MLMVSSSQLLLVYWSQSNWRPALVSWAQPRHNWGWCSRIVEACTRLACPLTCTAWSTAQINITTPGLPTTSPSPFVLVTNYFLLSSLPCLSLNGQCCPYCCNNVWTLMTWSWPWPDGSQGYWVASVLQHSIVSTPAHMGLLLWPCYWSRSS